jgi:hypothetical protein
MKKSDIYEVAIKILGIYLFFASISLLFTISFQFMLFFRANEYSNPNLTYNQIPLILLNLAHFGFLLLIAFWLTFRTNSIVTKVCKAKDYEQTTAVFFEKRAMLEIALLVTGLILVAWTLPDFIVKVVDYIKLKQNNVDNNNSDAKYIYTDAIKILMGFVTVIYAHAISGALLKKSLPNSN